MTHGMVSDTLLIRRMYMPGASRSNIHSGISISHCPVVRSRRNSSGKCSRSERCLVSSYSRTFSSRYAFSMWRRDADSRSPASSPSCRSSQAQSGMKRRVVWPRSMLKARCACRAAYSARSYVLRYSASVSFCRNRYRSCAVNLSRRKFLTSARLLDLPALAVQVGEGLVAAPLGAEDLAFRLLDLDRQHLRLVVPLVQPPQP